MEKSVLNPMLGWCTIVYNAPLCSVMLYLTLVIKQYTHCYNETAYSSLRKNSVFTLVVERFTQPVMGQCTHPCGGSIGVHHPLVASGRSSSRVRYNFHDSHSPGIHKLHVHYSASNNFAPSRSCC